MREDPQSFGETFFMALQLVLTSVEQIFYGTENAMVLWNMHVLVFNVYVCLVSQHFLWCIYSCSYGVIFSCSELSIRSINTIMFQVSEKPTKNILTTPKMSSSASFICLFSSFLDTHRGICQIRIRTSAK